MRTGAAGAVGARRHNENEVIMIAGLWRYGDWRHVATGCNALVLLNNHIAVLAELSLLPSEGREMSTSQSAVMLCGWGEALHILLQLPAMV